MAQRQYEPATVFNARIVNMQHLWNPSTEYQGQPTKNPNYFASFIVAKTQPQWHLEPALAGVATACGDIFAKNQHVVTWPVSDGDVPNLKGNVPEWAKGHWVFSASTQSPPNVELAQPNGTLVKLPGKVGVKSGDFVMVGVTAAVKQNDPRGVKFYLNAVVFSAPGDEIVFANSVSGAQMMEDAKRQGLQIAGFSGAPGFSTPAPALGGGFGNPAMQAAPAPFGTAGNGSATFPSSTPPNPFGPR